MNRSLLLITSRFSAFGAALLISSLSVAADPPVRDSRPAPRPTVAPQDDDGGIAGGTGNGPDVIVSTVGGGSPQVIFWGTGVVDSDTLASYSFQTVSCNLGDADAIWIDSTNLANPNRNQHPVIGNTLFRLKNGRFEQIGLGWLKHGFCAADVCSCGSPCEPNASCDWLGTHATDTYNSFRNGEQPGLGPRSEINPWTGVFPYPYVLNWNQSSTDPLFKRMRVNVNDLNPALNSGALYFGEVQYIATDEQPINRYNNVSYRAMTVGAVSGSSWAINFTGSTTAQQPAINAWRANDPSVVITPIDVPSDGRLYIGSKVTNLGGGQWQYEYALYNMNCDRAVQSFGVPFETSVGIANIGFHDISYHSGEPYTSVDWATSVGTSGVMSWESQTFAVNPNANALRWGTLYNFRFTANAPPRCTTATIGLFKPGASPSVTVSVPGPVACVADISPIGLGDGTVNINDLLEVINTWGVCTLDTSVCGCPADIDPPGGDDAVNINDLLGVINTWGDCP